MHDEFVGIGHTVFANYLWQGSLGWGWQQWDRFLQSRACSSRGEAIPRQLSRIHPLLSRHFHHRAHSETVLHYYYTEYTVYKHFK